MEMKNLSIGERIRARRKDLNHTQSTLAKSLKISHVSVSQWERDDSEPSGKNLFALSKILKCSPTWILFGDDEQAPDSLPAEELPLDDRHRELIELFDALPESEQDSQLELMRARVENFNRLFEEMLETRKRKNKPKSN